MNDRLTEKEAKIAGCLAAAVVFFVITILPVLVLAGLIWLIFWNK